MDRAAERPADEDVGPPPNRLSSRILAEVLMRIVSDPRDEDSARSVAHGVYELRRGREDVVEWILSLREDPRDVVVEEHRYSATEVEDVLEVLSDRVADADAVLERNPARSLIEAAGEDAERLQRRVEEEIVAVGREETLSTGGTHRPSGRAAHDRGERDVADALVERLRGRTVRVHEVLGEGVRLELRRALEGVSMEVSEPAED